MFRSNIPPANLPDGWHPRQLNDIARIHGGGRLGLTKSDYVDQGIPAYSAAGQDGYVDVVEGEEPSIILSSIGARCGKSFLANGPWATLANTQVITPDTQVADACYLIGLLDNEDYWNRSGSAQPFIKPSDVKGAWVPIPPLDEQRRIAEVLRSVDEAIAAKSMVVEQTQVVLSKARDDLLQVDTVDDGPMPDGWRHSTLGEVSVGKGEYGANVSKREYDAMLPRYIRITDIASDGELIETSLASITPEDAAGYMLEDGDLLFARSGATVGKTFLYDTRYGACAYAGYLIRFKIDCEKADPFFVRSAVQTSHYWKWIDTNQRAQAQPNVNAKEYASFPIRLPPLEQQQKIVETLRSLQESANQAKADLGKASSLKGALMSDLLSGRVRVPS